MRVRDLVRFAWKALSDRKLRASLTILGLVIGPATIVALVGATQGLSNGVTAQFSKTGATSIFLTPAARGVSFTSADVSVLQSMPGVAAVLPFYMFSGTVAQGTQTTPVQIFAGDFSKLNQVFPGLTIAQGSEPASSDLGGAAIGSTLAYPGVAGIPNFTISNIVPVTLGGGGFGASFGGGVQIFSRTGESSSTGSRSFIVRGIFTPFGQGFFINPDTGIFVPLATGQSITHSNRYTGIVVVANSPGTVDQVSSEITAHYGQNVRAISVSSILATIQSIIGGIGTFLGAIGGISVLVAFIGIMTTMFTTVVERTKEIGILKALGYSSRNILSIFLVEASVTGFIGGVVGAAAGAGLSFALVPLFAGGFSSGGGGARGASTAPTLTIIPAISPELILLAVGLATGVGMLAGLLPAWRASRLPPVDALRQE